MIPLIFHDQEPLDYEFNQLQIEQEFSDIIKDWKNFDLINSPLIKEFYKKMHLRSVLALSFYDSCLIVHSEKNSDQVTKFEKNNF